jgi:hypothetical protein
LPTRTPQTSDPDRPHGRSGQKALVIGGTGPSGPDVVHGLLERGFDTTIFHAGAHEVPLPSEVRHVHGDPHFPETIAEALGKRSPPRPTPSTGKALATGPLAVS